MITIKQCSDLFRRSINYIKTLNARTEIGIIPPPYIPESESIAIETSFSIQEIRDFVLLTGFDDAKTKVILTRFFECGVRNLSDINIIAKLGCL